MSLNRQLVSAGGEPLSSASGCTECNSRYRLGTEPFLSSKNRAASAGGNRGEALNPSIRNTTPWS